MVNLDPENNETAALLDFTGDLAGKRVLEIGSGEGRMTWRFASQAAFVVGIDPNTEKHASALKDTPPSLVNKVEFHATGLEDYFARWQTEASPRPFDLAILSWSL